MAKRERHGPIAVIDVETTGLNPFRHDRVVEIAAVVVEADGSISREFASLVNPGRDIGPSSIHGLNSADVLHAPNFGEVAAELVDTIGGTVAIAAHNARFDRQFILKEFERIDASLPDVFTICTMRLAGGGSLVDCCDCHGVNRAGDAHHALADARAAAGLLVGLLPGSDSLLNELSVLTPVAWPTVGMNRKPSVTRDESRRRQAEPPSFLQRLTARVRAEGEPLGTDASVLAYAAMLDRMLEDRHLSDAEGESLLEVAGAWGLTGDQIVTCHRGYVDQLAIAALADGVVTDAELRDLRLVGSILRIEASTIEGRLREAEEKMKRAAIAVPAAPPRGECELAGQRVCFTGELQCSLRGEPLTRDLVEALATSAGLLVADGVTKKLDLLVLADPQSQSGKAKKARAYGVRILHEPLFWRAIGVDVD